MNDFANLKNGKLTINSYRFVDATITTVDNLLCSDRTKKAETLTATIEDDSEREEVLKIINYDY